MSVDTQYSMDRVDLLICLDAEGKCVEAGPAPLVTGVFTELEVVGSNLTEVLTDPVKAAFEEGLAAAHRNGRSQFVCHLELPSRRLDIEVVLNQSGDLEVRGAVKPVEDPMRRPGADYDNDILRSVLSHLKHGVLLQGPQAEILMSNHAALELLGLSESQLLGSSSFDPRWHVIKEDGSDFPGEQHPVPTAIATRQPVTDVLMGVYRPRTDDRVWLSVNATPELDSTGNVSRVTCSFTDVTAKRVAEEKLKQDHNLLNEVMEASLSGIVVLDRTGRIVFGNNATEEILGLERSELRGRTHHITAWRFTDPEGREWPEDEQPFAQVISSREAVRDARCRIELPNGSNRELSLNGAPMFDGSGNVERVVLTIVDITEEARAAEERARVAEQLQRLSHLESLSLLAGGVAHDFNNLLVGLRSASTQLTRFIGSEHALSQEVDVIREATSRAAEITRQLLAFSGKGQFVVGPGDLSAVISDTTHLLHALTHANAQLRFDLAPALPAVEVDSAQIRQTVMNLVINASQAIDENGGGTIELRTRSQHVDTETLRNLGLDAELLSAGEYVVLEVCDDGMGMPDTIQRRIFDPFFTTKPDGQGLGLAAVHGVMRGHRGFVKVESTLGRGTTIRLGFPALGIDCPESVPAPEATGSALTGRFLLIDDDALVLQTLRRHMTACGCEVLVAQDGAQGLEVFRENFGRLDGVILDMVMPRLHGDAVLAEIRKEAPDLPVLLISGYSAQGVPDDAGPTSFMPKPFSTDEVVERLRALLGSVRKEA